MRAVDLGLQLLDLAHELVNMDAMALAVASTGLGDKPWRAVSSSISGKILLARRNGGRARRDVAGPWIGAAWARSCRGGSSSGARPWASVTRSTLRCRLLGGCSRALCVPESSLEDPQVLLGLHDLLLNGAEAELVLVDVHAVALALQEGPLDEGHLLAELLERGVVGGRSSSSSSCTRSVAGLPGRGSGDGADLEQLLGDRHEGRPHGLAFLGPGGVQLVEVRLDLTVAVGAGGDPGVEDLELAVDLGDLVAHDPLDERLEDRGIVAEEVLAEALPVRHLDLDGLQGVGPRLLDLALQVLGHEALVVVEAL